MSPQQKQKQKASWVKRIHDCYPKACFLFTTVRGFEERQIYWQMVTLYGNKQITCTCHQSKLRLVLVAALKTALLKDSQTFLENMLICHQTDETTDLCASSSCWWWVFNLTQHKKQKQREMVSQSTSSIFKIQFVLSLVKSVSSVRNNM